MKNPVDAVGAFPSAKLGSVAEARPPGRFEETSSEVRSRLDPRRVTPVTNFGWGVFLYPTLAILTFGIVGWVI